jgi:hypothetical protein
MCERCRTLEADLAAAEGRVQSLQDGARNLLKQYMGLVDVSRELRRQLRGVKSERRGS